MLTMDERYLAESLRALVSIAGLGLTVACGGVDVTDSARVERGLSVFRVECARCHGTEGLGDGPQAIFLYPKPRNFARGNFRVASNEGNFPTDDDLLRVVRDGMPGSAMPPFPHLSDSDLEAVVEAVKHLAVQARVEEILATARETNQPMTRGEATALVRDLFTPGAPLVLPPETAAADTSPALGKELFAQMCGACHAPDSHVVKRDMTDDTGAFLYPRDLSHALLLRSNSTRDLALTVTRGLPGTPMPAYELSAEELWPIVRYVESLVARNESELDLPPSSEVRTIALTGVADPGVWTEEEVDVGYEGTPDVAPARVVLHEGEDVLLVLESADVTHRFYSPALGLGPVEVYPGHTRTLRFRAPSPGVYPFFCTSLCGHCHYSMRGVIAVVAEGEDLDFDFESAGDLASGSCEDVPSPAWGDSVADRGAALFRKMQCAECHGEGASGGIENFNALPTQTVPALDQLAEELMFWRTSGDEIATISRLLEERADLQTLRADPPFAHYERFLSQYELFRQVVLEGRFTPPRDPSGAEPPLQMPAFQARVSDDEVDALLAYLLSRYEERDIEIEQPINFNHSLHVMDAALACVDCHAGADGGAAGLPSNVVCQDCHFPEDLDGSSSEDLVALIQSLERGEDLPWARVNQLPDHVQFSHLPHVESAGLACDQCHGDMASLERPPEAPFFRLRMSWCMDCHRQRTASTDCRACHARV